MFHMTPEELVKLKQLHASMGTGDNLDIPEPDAIPDRPSTVDAAAPAPKVDYPQMSPTAAADPYNKRAEDYNARASQLEDQSVQSRPQPQGTKQVLLSAARTAMENFGKYGAPGGYYGQEQEREKQFQTKNAMLASRAKELRGEAGKEQQLGMTAEAGARQENYQQGELASKNEQLDLTKSANTERARHNTATEDITSKIPHPIAEGAAVPDGKGGYTVPSPKPTPTKNLRIEWADKPGEKNVQEAWAVDENGQKVSKNGMTRTKTDTGQTSENNLTERSYEAHNKLIADEEKKHLDFGTRLGGLRDNLKVAASNPTAQAELVSQLTSAINGQGSGIRITRDMIDRTETSRSHWQDIQAWLQKWRTDPNTAGRLTTEQMGQIDQIIGIVEGKQADRGAAFDEARHALNEGYNDTSKHRQAWETLQGKLRAVNEGKNGGAALARSGADGSKHVNWSDLP